MKLFVLRHGQAEYSAPHSRLDSERRLTAVGREQVRSMLARSSSKLGEVELILVSPYVRTQQTAHYVSEAFPRAELQTWPELVPESDPESLLLRLQALQYERVLLVSHQPLVGTLLSYLCGQESGRYPVDTASLAAVEAEVAAAGLAEMLWLHHATQD